MGNSLRYLGLLGFLGLLGLVTDNFGFFGFFGFFAFFAYNKILPDERFKLNINKAGKNAFMVGLVLYPFAATIAAFSSHVELVYTFAYALNFALQILVFSLCLTYYEKNGDAQ